MVSSRRLPKRCHTKHAAKIFPSFDVILFFFSASVVKVESFCLLILSSNLFGLSLHSSTNFFVSLYPIISIFKWKFSVYHLTDFPVAMLNNGIFLVISNGFVILLSTGCVYLMDGFTFFILFDFMCCETSFFVILKSSNSLDTMLVRRLCDSS